MGFTNSNKLIESAALKGNLTLVKNLVAMSTKQYFISSETLTQLLSHDNENYEGDSENKLKIALFLMQNCEWKPHELFSGAQTSFTQWLIEMSHPLKDKVIKELLKLPDIQWLIRYEAAMSDLSDSIEEGEFDGFCHKFASYFTPHSQLGINYLPEALLDCANDYLTEQEHLELREYFTPSLKGSEAVMLSTLIFKVQPGDTLMLAKFIELGVSNQFFKTHTQQSIEQWCTENGYTKLFQLKHVKEQCELAKISERINRLTEATSTHCNFSELEATIISFLNTYFYNDLEAGIMALKAECNISEFELWKFAATHNMPELLSYPGLLPTKNATRAIHDQILGCIIFKESALIEILIEHARKHFPDALKFDKQTLDAIEDVETANHLKAALQPKSLTSVVSASLLSVFSFFVPESDPDDSPIKLGVSLGGINLD